MTQVCIRDRLNVLDVSGSVSLSILAGEIELAGSAKYLQNTQETEDEVCTTLSWQGRTYAEYMPADVEGDLINKACESSSDKPTHVVTSVTYGLNAHLEIRKKVNETSRKSDIAGALHIKVKTEGLEEFGIDSIGGNASVDIKTEDRDFFSDVDVTFFGDTIMPSPDTYEAALVVYQQLPNLTKNEPQIVSFSMSPIKRFCQDEQSILISIAEETRDGVSVFYHPVALTLESPIKPVFTVLRGCVASVVKQCTLRIAYKKHLYKKH